MTTTKIESQATLDAVTAAVDAASRRHAKRVTGVVRRAAGTANTIAKTVAIGALLGVRYLAGFAQGLVQSGNV